MKKIIKPRPVVTIQVGDESSRTSWLLPMLLGIVIIFGALAYVLWPVIKTFNKNDVVYSVSRDGLEDKISALKKENAELARELAFVKRSSEIDKKANVALVDELSEKEKHATKTKEELGFYKNIVSEEGLERGVEIRSFKLSPGDDSRDFSYKLVLTRSGSKKRAIRGDVEFRVQGKHYGDSVMLDWSKIRAKKLVRPSFKFQYFQTLEGDLRFPAGFIPENVLVKVKASGSSQPVQQSYSWNTIVTGGEKE